MSQATATVSAPVKRTKAENQEFAIRIVSYILVGLLALSAIYTAITQPVDFIQVFLLALKFGALYALIALGYTMVYGIIELINFSHGDLFMLAAVLSAILLVNVLDLTSPSLKAFLLMLAVLLAVMIFAAAINTLAERVAYRRLRRAPKLAPLITAVGLSFIYQAFGIQSWANGSGPKQWQTPFSAVTFSLGPIKVEWAVVLVLGVTIPLLFGLNVLVNKTRQGKAMRAVAQDQDASRLMGIDVDRTIAFTFAIGGALAGAAGLLYVQGNPTTSYNMGFQLGLIAFTSAVLGGIGNLNGAVLGGFVIGFIQQFNDTFVLGNIWSQSVVFGVLILVMVFKPEGLLGKPSQEKV